MAQPVNVAMLGASGRMGRVIVPLVLECDDLRLSGALAAPGDRSIGQDAGVYAGVAPLAVAITDDPAVALAGAQAAIDFTLPAVSIANAQICRERGCAMVIGTTGFDESQRDAIEDVARTVPVVLAPNMSLGVNLLFKLAELAARALNADYDIEIFEAHHRNKVDAPSGTALG